MIGYSFNSFIYDCTVDIPYGILLVPIPVIKNLEVVCHLVAISETTTLAPSHTKLLDATLNIFHYCLSIDEFYRYPNFKLVPVTSVYNGVLVLVVSDMVTTSAYTMGISYTCVVLSTHCYCYCNNFLNLNSFSLSMMTAVGKAVLLQSLWLDAYQ